VQDDAWIFVGEPFDDLRKQRCHNRFGTSYPHLSHRRIDHEFNHPLPVAIHRIRPTRVYGPSQNCFKVRLLAAHLGLTLDIVPVAIFRGEGALPEFRAKNPMGGVPVLETNSGAYLPESNAILTFLAEGTPYLPVDGMPRSQVVRWLMFEQRYIQTSISRLRYWTLTDKLSRFARDVPTARALGNWALDARASRQG
jgi:glutathione S-transferase